MPDRATVVGRPDISSTCMAKMFMKEGGRCCVIRIGAPNDAGNPRSRSDSACSPPVEAPIARQAIRLLTRGRLGQRLLDAYYRARGSSSRLA